MSEARDNVIVRIESIFSGMSNSASYNPKIFKVYEKLRQVNEGAYEPVLVSIGPIHHNKDNLKPMEKIKASYFYQFLQITNQTVERYVMKVRELEERARNCYSDFIQLPEGDKFVEMLLLDGFFMIQLFRKMSFSDFRVRNDYIFQSEQARTRVILDLLLVENQLPFFILEQLFDMTKSSHPDDKLSVLVLKQIRWVLPWNQDIDYHIDVQHVDDHLLGMVHKAFFPRQAFDRIKNESRPKFERINTALELEEAGIQIKMANGSTLTDVSFNNGVLQLPRFAISLDIETVFRNLIAHEQMLSFDHRPVTDYSNLMWYLVNSSKDVQILRRAGIFEHSEDDETVRLMFTQLGKHALFLTNNFSYLQVYDTVNKHCHHRHNRWMANLRRNYFNTPWAIMSVIAAMVLLILTTIQTVYSVIS